MVLKNMRKILDSQADVGPTVQALSHGEVEIRTSRRGPVMARRVGMHERLYAQGKISDSAWNWVCRYVRETEVAAGARPGKSDIEPATPWTGPLIYNRQCAANGFLRRAHECISAQDRIVLIAACVDCVVVAELGRLLGLTIRDGESLLDYTNRISGRVRTACARIIHQASGCS